MRLTPTRIRQGAPALAAPVTALLRRRNRPLVVQTLRSTGAATIAYLVALVLAGHARPLTAPLTALLVVQVTLYATLKASFRRVLSVVTGVLLAVAFASLLGFSWWSLGLLIFACQIAGHLLRVYPWVPEVAISGMLVLGLGAATTTASNRVIDTLIGAAVGVLFNITVAPPVYQQPASESIEDLARQQRDLLARIGRELREGASQRATADWLQQGRDLDRRILEVDNMLSRVEESLRLNPRALRTPYTGMILRTGLDTLEHCTVSLRGLCRSLADLSYEQGRAGAVYGSELAEAIADLLEHLATAVGCFGRMVTTEATAGAAQAEAEIADALAQARTDREHIATLLLQETGREPETWELHGSLLSNVDRILTELDLENRAGVRDAVRELPRGLRQMTREAWNRTHLWIPPGYVRRAEQAGRGRARTALRNARDRLTARGARRGR